MIKNPFEYLLDLLESPTCAICSMPGERLCTGCLHGQLIDKDKRCYICNKLSDKHGVCDSCPSRLRRVWWLGRYKEPLKDMIWQMKFQRQRDTARLFGAYLADVLPYIPEETVVTSLPTAPERIRRRGFDQAALIARVFTQKRQLTYRPLLERTNKVDLIGKSRQERIRLMGASMAYTAAEPLSGVTILLVDDVLTTGASMEAAASLLRENGARHIDAAVVAH